MSSFVLFVSLCVSFCQLSSCSSSTPPLVTTEPNFKENPALSLVPETDSNTVRDNLKRGVKVMTNKEDPQPSDPSIFRILSPDSA